MKLPFFCRPPSHIPRHRRPAIYHLPGVCQLLSALIPNKMDDVLSYSDMLFFFFFLAASFQSGKINSPYVFPLVHTFRRGWRIFQRRRRCRQTVTVVGRRSRRWAAKENRDRNRRMWSVGMKTLLFTNAPDRSRRRPCVAAPASQ